MSKQKDDVRANFRRLVFTRDYYRCVVPICNTPAVDAHHLIERAFWSAEDEFGGYIMDNGVSVCETHHRHAEKDFIPPQALREWAGITNRVLPKQFDSNQWYTKWGTAIKASTRQPWENIKYPHTPYLGFSPSVDALDVSDSGYFNLEQFLGKPLMVATKMDGSNALLTHAIVAARNGSIASHKSFDMLKAMHGKMSYLIPEDIQVFGEWLYAKHSIHYSGYLALPALFQVFAIYKRSWQMWLGWEAVKAWSMKLGFPTVPVVGMIEESNSQKLTHALTQLGNSVIKKGHEGIVVRSIYPFHYGQFSSNIAKYVRPNHVTTDEHWSMQPIVKNELAQNDGKKKDNEMVTTVSSMN